MTAVDRSGTDAPPPAERTRPEVSVEQSAELQSSRVPRPDGPPAARAEPFYREVHFTRADAVKVEKDVDALIATGDARPDQRSELLQTGREARFEAKALDGDFYSLDRYGTTESTMSNALPPSWYGEGAESRLYEVAPSPGTTYFAGRAAPQREVDACSTDLSGGARQAFVPRDTDRSGWEARPVARSEDELAALPQHSLRGYDDNGDIRVTPDSAHANDEVVTVHRADGDNPFAEVDKGEQAYATEHKQRWSGPTADKFAGSIEERVTPTVVTPLET